MMKQKSSRIISLISFLLMPAALFADPWFTGPLLALPGQTVPRGHINASLGIPVSVSNETYNREWQMNAYPAFKSTQIAPEFIYGLADHFDVQYDAIYFINENSQRSYEHVGDTSIMLGYQALTQTPNNATPDLRITLQEIFPSGVYDQLAPLNNGTDITGAGSYQTALGLNFQYLTAFDDIHYLNSHVSFTYSHAATVLLNGLSAYGGTELTNGLIAPGDSIGIDLAGEFTLTQHWAAVLEGNFIYQQASRFRGVADEETTRTPRLIINNPRLSSLTGGSVIGKGNLDQITLAPGIEYNFSANYGVVAGAWFTIAGKNTPSFVAPMILLNAYW